MKPGLIRALALLCSGVAQAEPVTGWVTTNGDAGYSGGSEATNSPVTTSADADTIVGSFPETTLEIDQTLTLSGTIEITGRIGSIPGNQIRWGLFDAPGTPTTGVGDDYVGVWATANGGPADIRAADGSTGNPFSGSAATVITTETGTSNMLPDTSYDFLLNVTRVSATEISVSGSLTESDGGAVLNSWAEVTGPASPADFTYDCVGILLGGTTDATQATLTDVEVSGGEPEGEDLVITALSGSPAAGDLTLTWVSNPGAIYAVDSSPDLMNWPEEIDDNVPASAEGNATSFAIPSSALEGQDRIFFRVREVGP